MENIKFSPEAFELLKRLLRAALEERPIRDEVREKVMTLLGEKVENLETKTTSQGNSINSLNTKVTQILQTIAEIQNKIENGTIVVPGQDTVPGGQDFPSDPSLIKLYNLIVSATQPSGDNTVWFQSSELGTLVNPDTNFVLDNGTSLDSPIISFTSENDVTYTLNVGAGEDTVSGGENDDTVPGGTGEDTVPGGTGEDTVPSGTGDDTVPSGTGDDTASGGTGDDTTSGGTGTGSDDPEFATDEDIDSLFDD